MMAATSGIAFLEVTVRGSHILEDIQPVLKVIRPQWQMQDLCMDTFSKGFINAMVCLYVKQDADKQDALVVRVHRVTVGEANDKDKEFLAQQIAHAAGCFPPIYAAFTNGMVYKFMPGRTTTYEDFVKPEVAREITSKLYHLHSINIDSLSLLDRRGNPAKFDQTFRHLDMLNNFIAGIPDKANDPSRDVRFQELRKELTNERLREELQLVTSVLDDIQPPICFNHGDLHFRNMVYDEDTTTVTLVDYEVSAVRYEVQDLSRFFILRPVFVALGLVKAEDTDFTAADRKLWVRSYLEAKYRKQGKNPADIPESELELLDLEHSILEIVALLECTAMPLALVNLDIDLDGMTAIDACKDRYYARKGELPGLRYRYLKLKSACKK